MIALLVTSGVVVVSLLTLWGIYNSLVGLRNLVKNAWAQIDVQLKRRHDLIPNLVETVKGYKIHERETLEAVTKARNEAQRVLTLGNQERARAEGELGTALSRLFAVAESYPELKASQNFIALQEELATTENKISFSRQFYNDSVMRYNNQTQMFPSSVVAAMFGFKPSEFFEVVVAEEKEAPKVKFA